MQVVLNFNVDVWIAQEISAMVYQVVLVNLSKVNPTSLNNVPVQESMVITHNDIFMVSDRSFRVEFPYGSPSRVLQPVSNAI